MPSTIGEAQRRLLQAIFERGAEQASQALSQWLGQRTHVAISRLDELDLAEVSGILGPDDELVAACCMDLAGRLTGHLLLVFDDRAGLALADLLLGREPGTSSEWSDLERSAALETANIVGCAFVNSLAQHLPGASGEQTIVPSPPTFRHEFAASLLEFAAMEQAMTADRVVLAETAFSNDMGALRWSLLLIPGGGAAAMLTEGTAPA